MKKKSRSGPTLSNTKRRSRGSKKELKEKKRELASARGSKKWIETGVKLSHKKMALLRIRAFKKNGNSHSKFLASILKMNP